MKRILPLLLAVLLVLPGCAAKTTEPPPADATTASREETGAWSQPEPSREEPAYIEAEPPTLELPADPPAQSQEAAQADDPPMDPQPASSAAEGPAPDPGYMETIRIVLLDGNGNPVGNLCVNLAHTGGPEGSYMPGDALTRFATGAVLREAHPAAYNVIVTDRKQLDYAGASQRGQMVFPIQVVKDGAREFTFVWENPTPRALDLAVRDKVILTFVDSKGDPVPDLWVNLTPAADTDPEPRQIVLGHTDASGTVYWPNYETGAFEGGALLSTTDGDGPYLFGDPISFTVTGPGAFSFTWEGKSS